MSDNRIIFIYLKISPTRSRIIIIHKFIVITTITMYFLPGLASEGSCSPVTNSSQAQSQVGSAFVIC